MDERREVVEVDLSGVSSSHELHAALAKALDFPDVYGHNWDAFWDAITGLVEMPVRLRLRGWTALAARLPSDTRLLRRLLEEMAEKYPRWAAEVEYV